MVVASIHEDVAACLECGERLLVDALGDCLFDVGDDGAVEVARSPGQGADFVSDEA